jgi:hypothetical protein
MRRTVTKGTNPSTWNVKDLKNMVKWFKLPSGPALPTHRQELIERYEQTKLRTVSGTILPDAAPMPDAMMSSMPTLGISSTIDTSVLKTLMYPMAL